MTRQELIEAQARRTGAPDIESALQQWREGEKQAAFAVAKERLAYVERVRRMRALTPR